MVGGRVGGAGEAEGAVLVVDWQVQIFWRRNRWRWRRSLDLCLQSRQIEIGSIH